MADSTDLAIFILPPRKQVGRIQSLRNKYEGPTQFRRWPPHITVVPPINVTASEKDELLESLTRAVSDLPFFDVEIKRVDNFTHGGSGKTTMFVGPDRREESVLQSTFKLVSKAVDFAEPRGYTPHMTICRSDVDAMEPIKEDISNELKKTKLKWTVEGLYVLERNRTDPAASTRIVQFVPFRGGRSLIECPMDYDSDAYAIEQEDDISARYGNVFEPSHVRHFMKNLHVWSKLPCFQWNGDQWKPVNKMETIVDLDVLTLNVQADSPEENHRLLISHLRRAQASIIALQEATPEFVKLLISNEWVKHYYVSQANEWIQAVPEGETIVCGMFLLSKYPFHHYQIRLSPHKHAQAALFSNLIVGHMHLPSSKSANQNKFRMEQLNEIKRFVDEAEVETSILLGDFNVPDFDELSQMVLGYRNTAQAHTFDPTKNSKAFESAVEKDAPKQYAYVLLRGSEWRVASFELVGTEGAPVSDHYGLLVRFSVQKEEEKSYLSDSELELLIKGEILPFREKQRRQDAFSQLESFIGHRCLPYGSYALGVDTPSSDIDVVCLVEGSMKAFELQLKSSLVLEKRIVLTRKAPNVYIFNVNSISFDVYCCSPTPSFFEWLNRGDPNDEFPRLPAAALKAINGWREAQFLLSRFETLPFDWRLSYRFIRLWAKRKGVYGSPFGFLNGIWIATLLEKACQRSSSAHEAIDRFFKHSNFDADVFTAHPPKDHINRLATDHSRRILRSLDFSDWDDLLVNDVPRFFQSYESFIHVHLSSVSKERLVVMMAHVKLSYFKVQKSISEALPQLALRIWPEAFMTDPSESDDDEWRNASFLIGLQKMESKQKGSFGQFQKTLDLWRDKIVEGALVELGFDEHAPGQENFMTCTILHLSKDRVDKLKLVKFNESDDHTETVVQEDDSTLEAEIREYVAKRTKRGGKMKSSEDIIHRLTWDPVLSKEEFVVGYLDRFRGVIEKPLCDFVSHHRGDQQVQKRWIPLHRIVHFRRVRDDLIVWDRETKTDLLQ
ncbi:hypothetical protein BJ742DRAFT_817374 [Cladochytrium replicatum]|nr:hypothetical protein BJ742DRAFT_817374 [Cladochytrium replicatum]